MTNITIDDKTKIPLFAAATIVVAVIGFTIWLSSIAAQASEGSKAKVLVEDIRLDIVEMKSDIKYIKENTPRRR